MYTEDSAPSWFQAPTDVSPSDKGGTLSLLRTCHVPATSARLWPPPLSWLLSLPRSFLSALSSPTQVFKDQQGQSLSQEHC